IRFSRIARPGQTFYMIYVLPWREFRRVSCLGHPSTAVSTVAAGPVVIFPTALRRAWTPPEPLGTCQESGRRTDELGPASPENGRVGRAGGIRTHDLLHPK